MEATYTLIEYNQGIALTFGSAVLITVLTMWLGQWIMERINDNEKVDLLHHGNSLWKGSPPPPPPPPPQRRINPKPNSMYITANPVSFQWIGLDAASRYKGETGKEALDVQGEYNKDYVKWLEQRIL